MSCIVLIGGVIGCGKTTLVDYLQRKESDLWEGNKYRDFAEEHEVNNKTVFRIILDELCPLEEQANMMDSLKAWRCFRVDLLMAAEHFINSLCQSKFVMEGPLTARSYSLVDKINEINGLSSPGVSQFIFLVEDNFYYRSMRYDWFQLARRANIGFCECFLVCPLKVAVSRNAQRGYRIPEEKIKMMLNFMEYPDPEKYKWEKYSLVLNSVDELEESSVKTIFETIDEAAKNPAEMMITADKVEAQLICSKNVIHQADNILRKLVSKKVTFYRDKIKGNTLKDLVLKLTEIRQNLLNSIKQGSINFPQTLLENFRKEGITSVMREFEKVVIDLFEDVWNKKLIELKLCAETHTSQDADVLLPMKYLNLEQ